MIRYNIHRQSDWLKCKFCGSEHIVKYGRYQGVQRYFCKRCRRKFADNGASLHMKTPSFQVASALNMFYENKPICSIRRYMEQKYNSYPSFSTIYRWIIRFTKLGIEKTAACRPAIGDVWIAAETPLKVNGEHYWILSVVDSRTRFLLACSISQSRSMQNTMVTLTQATEKAGKFPRRIITSTLTTYLNYISSMLKKDMKGPQPAGFKVRSSKGIVKKVNKPLRNGIKIIRKAKKGKTAKLLLKGCLIQYNFIKTHKKLNNRTPAEKAGVGFCSNGWLTIISEDDLPMNSLIT